MATELDGTEQGTPTAAAGTFIQPPGGEAVAWTPVVVSVSGVSNSPASQALFSSKNSQSLFCSSAYFNTDSFKTSYCIHRQKIEYSCERSRMFANGNRTHPRSQPLDRGHSLLGSLNYTRLLLTTTSPPGPHAARVVTLVTSTSTDYRYSLYFIYRGSYCI